MKKSSFSIVFIVIFAFSFLLSFMPDFSTGNNAVDNGYYLNAYDVSMTVNEDNSYAVEETISTHFNDLATYGESHGIYRYIPTVVTASRDTANGLDTKKYGIKISNVLVTDQFGNSRTYSVDHDSGYCIISSLDDNLVNDTTQVYVISYEYSVGYDRISTYDDLYYNIIGTQWDTSIDNITFSVTMPTAFDGGILTDGSVLMYSGAYGSADPVDLTNFNVTINGNTLSGSYAHLNAFEGITLKWNLPECYFNAVNMAVFSNIWDIVALIICIIILMICVIYAVRNSIINSVIETVQFYPPDNLNPTELKYILSGSVTSKDLTALIIYWASKGYLKVIVDEKEDITLEKLKDLTSENQYENAIFEKLFQFSSEVKLNESANVLAEEVFAAIPKVRAKIGARIEEKSVGKFIAFFLLNSVPILLSYFIAVLRYNLAWDIVMFPLVLSLILLNVFGVVNLVRKLSSSKIINKISIIVSVLLFAGSIALNIIYYDPTIDYLGSIFFALAFSHFSAIYLGGLVYFKDDISVKLGKIRGFKNFIVTAEAPRLKMLLKQNPEYYFDVLPYAYVMNVTNEFAKRFENLAIAPPSWYVTSNNNVFSLMLLNNLFSRSLNSFNFNAMRIYANNRSNIHGGSGGFGSGSGGFSGGGFGGGGGGRG